MKTKLKYYLSIIAVSILVLISFQSLSANRVNRITPLPLDWSMVAGCTKEECIDVYNPDCSGTFEIQYTILPDGDGFEITAPKTVFIKEKETKEICFTIKTSILLMPKEYHVGITLIRVGTCGEECDLTIRAWHSRIFNFKQAYFKVKVSGDPNINGVYRGWCIDLDSTMVDGRKYTATAISSYDTTRLVEHPENLDLVNWILNQNYIGKKSGCEGRFTYGDIQRAIWALLEDHQSGTYRLGTWTQCRINKIVANAKAYGEGYIPKNGDVIAVILKPCDIKKAQICIIEVPVNSYNVYAST